jgi:hypothetical protein
VSAIGLALVLLAALVVGGIVVSWRRSARRIAHVGGPLCGGCGYNVSGLETLLCPECGGDLRRVGIRVPHAAASPRSVGGELMTIVLALASGAVFLPIADELLPRRLSFSRITQFRTPDSGGYAGADVSSGASAWSAAALTPHTRVQLITRRGGAGSSPLPVLDVNPDTGGYAYLGPAGVRASAPAGFDGNVVLAWMKSAGLDISDPRLRREAATLAIEARRAHWLGLRFGSTLSRGSSSSGSRSPDGGFATHSYTESSIAQPSPALKILVIGGLVAAWLFATIFLVRRCVPASSVTISPRAA